MKKSANALKALEEAIAEAADALAKEGLYIENVTINSRWTERDPFSAASSYPHRYSYKREIMIRLTNKVPDYILSP